MAPSDASDPIEEATNNGEDKTTRMKDHVEYSSTAGITNVASDASSAAISECYSPNNEHEMDDNGRESTALDGKAEEDESITAAATTNDDKNPTGHGLSQQFSSFRKRLNERLPNRATTLVNSAASFASEAEAAKAAREKQSNQPTAVEIEMERLQQESDLDSMRASQISVTVVRDSHESYGFALVQEEENKKVVVKVDVLAEEGLLHDSPLKVGDTLKAINNKRATTCERVMEGLLAMDGPVTLVVETPKGNPSVVQAFCRKPSPESLVGIGFHVLEHGNHKLLQINHISSNGLLSRSVLSQGDIVLAINDVPCTEKSPQEAAALILESTSIVTIFALNPKLANQQQGGTQVQRWIRNAKRAGIAIGGGTMVGVGLIFIPTLPPPFGEVLIIGGVSVLGTEFEAPKRLVQRTRDSLERAVGREEPVVVEVGEQQNDSNGTSSSNSSVDPIVDRTRNKYNNAGGSVTLGNVNTEELEAAVTSTLTSSNSTSDVTHEPKQPMKDRIKSFGRSYVLPFLDQVVGDRTNNEESKV